MKIEYKKYRPGAEAALWLERSDDIIDDYQSQGFTPTLRQLYYQHVTKNWIANNEANYKRLGEVITKGRYGGFIAWDGIQDRGRNLMNPHTIGEVDIREMLRDLHRYYHLDLHEDQEYRLEIWVEKDALAEVVSKAALRYDIPYLPNKGYLSASEMHDAAQRLRHFEEEMNQQTIILHLGDHDPSGLDMTRDIQDRLNEFGSIAIVERVALNMDQIREYDPPENPAKSSDARYIKYVSETGTHSSWELDALPPKVIDELLDRAIRSYLDMDRFEARKKLLQDKKRFIRQQTEEWAKLLEL